MSKSTKRIVKINFRKQAKENLYIKKTQPNYLIHYKRDLP